MLERGDYEIGSIQELVAIRAKQTMNRLRRMELNTLVKAMLTVANASINPSEVNFNGVNESLNMYSETLFPEVKEDREQSIKNMQKIMRQEQDKILKISALAEPSTKAGRLQKKRK